MFHIDYIFSIGKNHTILKTSSRDPNQTPKTSFYVCTL